MRKRALLACVVGITTMTRSQWCTAARCAMARPSPCVLCGLAGSYLTLAQNASFTPNMTAGRG